MRSPINISSALLLLPYIYHRNNLTTYESIGVICVAIISFLFHTAREQITETGSLNNLKDRLYKLDHLQISLGLAYLSLKSLNIYPLSIATIIWYIIIVVNNIVAYKEWENIVVTTLLVFLIIHTVLYIILNGDIWSFIALIIGITLAKNGYKGTDISGIHMDDSIHKKNTYPQWNELHKIMWHGGSAIIITVILLYVL
jgi:hypothetical protein